MVYNLIVITGAGGVGKTSISNILKNKLESYHIVDFDEGGVPEVPTVEWRKERTNFWVEKLVKNHHEYDSSILCGLCFPSEIKESLYFNNNISIKYILLHLNFDLLQKRLLEDRHWPEFLIQGQKIWQEQLLSEISFETHHSIIDVENKTIEEVATIILDLILE